MKKLLVIAALSIGVIACTKKATPAKTPETPVAPAPASEGSEAAATAPKLSKEAVAGMETYNAKCGKCHDLPKTSAYTADRWQKIVDWMAPKAKLTEAEKANVLIYVQFMAKPA